MLLLVSYMLIYGCILTLVALGGMMSERSGVMNIGLEGTMVVGALAGTLVMREFDSGSWLVVPVTILVSVGTGILFSLLLAVATVTFNADQTLVGCALNTLAVAGATVLVKAINTSKDKTDVSSIVNFTVNNEKFEFKTGSLPISIYLPIVLVVLIFIIVLMNKTRFGMRLSACGEHPFAVDSVGVSVRKMRYAGVAFSGALGGLGGIIYVTVSVNEWNFEYGVAGIGFLALAVMMFGRWKPVTIAFSALIFGLFRALSDVYSGIKFFEMLGFNSTFYKILPYVICLIILAVSRSNSKAPKSVGVPYIKGQL